MTGDEAVAELVENIARQTGVPVRLLVAPLPEWGTPERFVLWGGRVGRDAWVASMWDRVMQERLARAERWRRINRQLSVTMRVMTGAFTKAVKQAEAQMAAFGKVMREGGALPPEV